MNNVKKIFSIKEQEIIETKQTVKKLEKQLEKANYHQKNNIPFAIVGDSYEGLKALSFLFEGEMTFSKYGDEGIVKSIQWSDDKDPFSATVTIEVEDTKEIKSFQAYRLN